MTIYEHEIILTINVKVSRKDKKPISKELRHVIKEEILGRCEDGVLKLSDPEEEVLDDDNETIEGEEYEIVYEFPMI